MTLTASQPPQEPTGPRKRVCHVIFKHRIFDGRVFFKEAASLARAGYNVVLLAPALSGTWLGRRKEHRLTDDAPLVREGVRFESYPYRRWIPKVLGLRFAACRRDMLAALERIQPDICHFHEDEITMDVAAELKHRLPNTKLIFDYHEFYLHQMRVSASKQQELQHFVVTENRVLASADGVITVSDFISEYYRTLTDKPVVTVMNSQSARLFQDEGPPPPPDGYFWVVHEGSMSFDRGLRHLVRAARLVRSPHVRFLLIGGLPPGERAWFDEQTARDGTAARFHVTDMLPYQEVPRWLRRGHAGLCLNESPNALTGTPNKFFNYLRFGLAILTLEHPIMGPIVQRAGCGIVIPRRGTPAALAAAIDQLANDSVRVDGMSTAAARLFADELNWERMEERLLGLYREVLSDHAD